MSGRSHLRISDNGRFVTDFVVASRCAPTTPFPPIPIRSDGTFRAVGRVAGEGGGIKFAVKGRFVSARTAEVRLRFVAASCDGGLVAMTLRLS